MKKIRRTNITTLAVVIAILAIVMIGTTIVLELNANAACADGEHTYGTTLSYYKSASTGEARHGYLCTKCSASAINYHTPDWSNKDGICAVSGCGVTCHDCGGNVTSGQCSTCGLSAGRGEDCETTGNHAWGSWENTGVGVHVRECSSCGATESQNCEDYSSWVSYGDEGHHLLCSICNSVTTPRDHEYSSAFSVYKSASTGTKKHGRACTVCGTNYTDDHTFVKGSTVNGICAYSGCGLTCEACGGDGPTSGTCSTCGVSSGNGGGSQDNCYHTICSYTDNGNGTHTKECSDCDYSINESHNPGDWQQLTNYHIKECRYCDAVVDTEIHDTDGPNGSCSVCGYVSSAHSHDYTYRTNVVQPTCSAGGYTEHICSCGDSYTDSETSALGHDWKTYSNPATCTEDGESGEKCSRCDETRNEQKISAIGHNWETYSNPATCTEDGESGEKCSRCDETRNEQKISAIGHNWETYSNPATCTEDGESGEKCSRCDETRNEQKIPAAGHNWQSYTIPATCTENGERGEGCDVCNETQNVQIIPATGHGETSWKHNTTEHWEECTECRTEIEGTRAPHDYDENGECECGAIVGEVPCEHPNTSKEWKTDNNEHWQVCKDCGEEVPGTRAPHDYDENGECECGTIQENGDCTHENTTMNRDKNEHWEECVDCKEEIPGTRKPHDYDENGECKCGAIQEDDDCTHENTTIKRDENEHWEECVDCKEEIPGTRELHNYDGHGECECGAIVGKVPCEHQNTSREWKTDKDEHWQVCKDCGEEIPGTRGKHNYIDGNCKNCRAKEDGTTAGTGIPNTGSRTIIIVASAIIVAMVAGVVGMKKYKGV